MDTKCVAVQTSGVVTAAPIGNYSCQGCAVRWVGQAVPGVAKGSSDWVGQALPGVAKGRSDWVGQAVPGVAKGRSDFIFTASSSGMSAFEEEGSTISRNVGISSPYDTT